MRTIITFGSLVIMMVVSVLLHCSIISSEVRDNEVYEALNSAFDYGIDICSDIYSDIDYDSDNKDEYIQRIMDNFVNAVSERIGSDGEVTVSLLYADMDKGFFDIMIKETYNYPIRNRKGVCMCERSVALIKQ